MWDRSSWVEPVLSWDKCVLLKDHNAVTPVRLEPAALRSRVKHSTTEPLRSLEKKKKKKKNIHNSTSNLYVLYIKLAHNMNQTRRLVLEDPVENPFLSFIPYSVEKVFYGLWSWFLSCRTSFPGPLCPKHSAPPCARKPPSYNV